VRALIRKAAEHPVSVLTVYAALCTLGILSLLRLDWELLPDLPTPVARVITEYSGIPAPEVEQLVTVPLENALASVKGVREIESVSKDELSAVTLRFDWGIDPGRAAVQAREAVDAVYPYLPFGVRKPLVFTEDAGAQPVLAVAVVPAPGRRLEEIGRSVQGELATLLRQVPGVASVRLVGLAEAELLVEVDGAKLEAAGLSLEAVAATVATSVYELPLGTVVENGLEYLVKAGTGVATPEALRGIPLSGGSLSGGRQRAAVPGLLTLGEVATVRPGVRERTSFFHWNGTEAIGMFFHKSGEAGSLNAVRNIRRRLEEVAPRFAADCSLEIVGDTTVEIRRGLRGLLAAIGLGILATVGVLLLVFRRPGIALAGAAAIPASMTAVFLAMHAAGIGLNIVSLAGMAIGIGMIVDNAIVVLENLLRRAAGTPEEIARGTLEMVSATFGSTVTTLLVFLPVIFVPGVIGALFRELALTVSFLVGASFLVSLSLTPALYRLLAPVRARAGDRPYRPQAQGALARKLEERYRRLVAYSLERPWLPLSVLALLLGAGAAATLRLPREILPRTETPVVEAQVRFPAGTPVESCLARSLELDARLRGACGAAGVFAEAGFDRSSLPDRAEPGRLPQSVRYRVTFPEERGRSTAQRLAAVAEALSAPEDVRWSATLPADSFTRVLQARDLVEYRLSGVDRERLVSLAGHAALELTGTLAREVAVDTVKEMPRLSLTFGPYALAAAGLTPAGVVASLQTAVQGAVPAALKLPEQSLDIRVRLARKEGRALEELGRVRLRGQGGGTEARLVADFQQHRSYPELYRHGRRPAVTLRIHPEEGRRAQLLQYLRVHSPGDGELLSVSRLAQSRIDILGVFAVALLLIYLVLGAQFDSLLVPLLVMSSLPLAAAGSLSLLAACGYSLNINSLLGMLILLGTAVNAAIILAAGYRSRGAFARGRTSAGTGRRERAAAARIVEISVARLRPIAATVLTTTVAVLPIALSVRGQAVQQSHTAVALIGGLLSGSAAVLLVFPFLYYRLGPGETRRRRSPAAG